MVVAESLSAARDAAELIDVDYEALPAVVETTHALEPGRPTVWAEAPGNLAFDWGLGDQNAVEQAMVAARHRVGLDLVNNRIVVNSMEPRGAIGEYEPGEDAYTLWSSTQGSHFLRNLLAESVFKIPENRIRVVTRDVGGGFGMKFFLYPEHILVLWAAKKLGRPVKWTPERSDAFMTDTQGRDNLTRLELALDDELRFLGLKVATIANMGAYLSNFAPEIPTGSGGVMFSGVYAIPAIHVAVKGVFTHTVPVDAYRGAGRPEAAYVIERLVDACARKLGMTPDAIRRKNFITPKAMPYTTATGKVYDSGDFIAHMKRAMDIADWKEFPRRAKAAKKQGLVRGIGLATYVEVCGTMGEETADVRLDPNGDVTILIGTQSSGQGHQTAYAQIVAEQFGLPPERVHVFQGDTDMIATGLGTGGSASIPSGGVSVERATRELGERLRDIAAEALETSAGDLEINDGTIRVAGTDRSISFADLANRPGVDASKLNASATFAAADGTFPTATPPSLRKSFGLRSGALPQPMTIRRAALRPACTPGITCAGRTGWARRVRRGRDAN